VRAFRAAAHDVVAVAEVDAGAENDAVIEMAMREGRIFVTKDHDFGQLIYAAAKPARGAILLRFPSIIKHPAPPTALADGRHIRTSWRIP
jgi:predicted nuclease of predicted toxin-antitoxin system